MTRSEYQELVAFLGPKFDAMEGRLTRVEVGLEENRHQIQIVAEGVTALREEMTREFAAVRSEMAGEFSSVRGEMAEGFRAWGSVARGPGARA